MSPENKDTTPVTNGNDGTVAITEALQATSLQDLGRKVFVGNLNFATKAEQLREVFGSHGNIADVQIIFRGTRSLGYGFVTFETVHDAEKAVAATDKAEIDGRIVNVEIAKPTPGTPGGAAPRAGAKATKASKASSASKENGAEEHKEGEADPTAPRGSRVRRGRGRGRGRGGRFGRSRRPTGDSKSEADGGDHAEVSDGNAANGTDDGNKPSSKTTRSKRGRGGLRGEPRPRRTGPPEGEPSKTLLFVANLPFGLTDEGLKEFFSSYKATSAHIVRKRYGTTVGRSKGFGFVEFETEEGQLKALAETEGKELEGRALHVKIAVNEEKKEAEPIAESGGDGDA